MAAVPSHASMALIAPPRWRMNPLVTPHWRDWGGDAIVYEASSGQTHQFDPLTAAVVARFAEHADTLDGICAYLADAVEPDQQPQLRDTLGTVINRLLSMGWLQSIPE